MRIATQTVGGQEVDVNADARSGRRTIRLPDADGFRSLDEDITVQTAIGQAQRTTAKHKVRVEAPFMTTAGEHAAGGV